jgi:hypothetical protein
MYKLFRPAEVEFYSNITHNNPFMNVSVTGTFIHKESNEKIVVPGFWKGENKWAVRFLPNKTGEWDYLTESNDPSLITKGSLTVVENDKKTLLDKYGFVRLSKEGRYFEYADGTPFFWLGDTHWQATDIAPLDKCNYPDCKCNNMFEHCLKKRKEQGYNVYQTYPSGADNDGGGNPRTNWWKEKYSLIDPEAFNSVFDKKMELLLEHGFTVVMGLGVHFMTPRDMGDSLNLFAKYIVARYSAYPVLWIVGQEIDACHLNGLEESHRIWNNAAETIYKYDGHKRPLGTHLVSREYFDQGSSSPEYERAPWHQWWALQAGHRREIENPTLRPKTKLEGYYRNSKKTYVETESFYEDLRCSAEGFKHGPAYSTGYELSRNSAWHALLSGSPGFTYGAHGVWGMRWDKDPKYKGWHDSYNSEPWYMGIEKPFGNEMRFIGEFFKNIDFRRLVPCFYETEYGEFSDKERAVMATDKNSLYLVYLYGSKQIQGKLKRLDPKRDYTVYWFDTRTGGYITAGGFSGKEEYDIPCRSDKNDWLLIVSDTPINTPYKSEFYKTEALEKPVGTPVKYKAFTVFTDDTTKTEDLENGKLWRPFAADASNIIELTLEQEQELSAIEIHFEENKTKKYSYRVDGISENRIHILSDRISEKTDKSKIIDRLEGKYKKIVINFRSEEAFIDENNKTVAGIKKITVYKKEK